MALKSCFDLRMTLFPIVSTTIAIIILVIIIVVIIHVHHRSVHTSDGLEVLTYPALLVHCLNNGIIINHHHLVIIVIIIPPSSSLSTLKLNWKPPA